MLIRREVVLIGGAAPPMSTVSAHKLNKNKNKNCQPSSGLPITDVIAHVAHAVSAHKLNKNCQLAHGLLITDLIAHKLNNSRSRIANRARRAAHKGFICAPSYAALCFWCS